MNLKSMTNISVALVVSFFGSTVLADGSGMSINEQASKSFLDQFLIAGGPIVWIVLLPLSVITLYLTCDYMIVIRQKRLLPPDAGGDICNVIRYHGVSGLVNQNSTQRDMINTAIVRAVKASEKHHTKDHLRMMVIESLQEQSLVLMRRIEWSNIIGSVAPMVGLLGTVFGMIKSFNQIAMAGGQPRVDQLADGISIALITTFWGLLIAIPALAVHGVFRNRIETITSEASIESEMVLEEIENQIKLRAKRKENAQEKK